MFATASNSTLAQFDLSDGTGETQVFKSGPGVFQIAVTPGGDTAAWSVEVEDHY